MSGPRTQQVRLAVATVTFCTLAYEITLTRIFSVLFRSPFVFLVLSVAVCGMGLGAALAALLDARRPVDDEPAATYLGTPLLAFALLLPLPIVLLLTVASGFIADARGGAVAVITAAPYLAAGLFVARAFRLQAHDAGVLYFWDLAGAGLAALVAASLLTTLGAVTVPIALGALAALAAMLLVRRGWAVAAVALALVCAVGAWGQARSQRLGLPVVRSTDDAVSKPLFRELGQPSVGAKVLYTEWSPVARTDVVSNTGTPTLFIWTDGDVPTQMEPFDGNLNSLASYQGFIGFVPYGLRPKPDRVLCIGPGGGLDCLVALLGGAKQLEPVELNPAIPRVVRRFRNFYGDLYSRPEMGPGLIIDEGRSYMSRSSRQYDVIYFALAKSATTQQGGLALVDNYLYTKEAFEQYWSKLSERGLLALVLANPALTDRCVSTMVDALLGLGMSGDDIADRLAYMGIREGFEETPYQFLMLLSKQPYSERERTILGRLGQSFDLRFAPQVAEKQPYATLRTTTSGLAFAKQLAARDEYLVRMSRGGPLQRVNLSPVTDDHPFYADLAPGLNPLLRPILRFSLLAGLLAIGLALAWAVVRGEQGWRVALRVGWRPVLYFAGLGAGYLLVEVALIQKLVLILGYPTRSLTVILFTLLVGSAVGGLLANRGSADHAMRRLAWLGPALALYQVTVALAAPALAHGVLTAPLWVRVAVVVAAVFPLGVLMGQPFPSGLRWLGERRAGWVPMAWAVNGVLSVTGSVVAAAISSVAGYRMVLLVGAAIYLLTCWLGVWWRAAEAPTAEGVGLDQPNEPSEPIA